MAGIDNLAAVMGRDADMDHVERDRLCDEAAAEIERLRAALAEQNEACARVAEKYGCGNPDCDECHGNIIAAAIRGLE